MLIYEEAEHRDLELLQEELAKRGVKCEVDTRTFHLRLRIFGHAERTAAEEFENSVLVINLGGALWFCWPWCEPIARVTEITRAADHLVAVYNPDEAEDEDV